MRTTVEESGRAYIDLAAGGEIRDSVELGEPEDAERVPPSGSLVLPSTTTAA